MGAQTGAGAVDAGPDGADRDAGGVRDLGVGQIGPGVQQQRVPVDARHLAQGGPIRTDMLATATRDAAVRLAAEVMRRAAGPR